MALKIKVHEKITDDGIISNIPLQKRAIKDMLAELQKDSPEDYNPKDTIQVNKYVHDTAIVTPDWLLNRLTGDKSAKAVDMLKQGKSAMDVAAELGLLDVAPVIWLYEDKDGTDAILVWKN